MPGGDKSGPMGEGPATGRGMGPCQSSDGSAPRRGFWGRGFFRRGWGRGFGRFFSGQNRPVIEQDEKKKED
jgi:hypothetical protein